MQKIVIIDYGTGNVQSVKYALERLGIDPVLSRDPVEISEAEKVILPGVGAAATAMKALHHYELDNLIKSLKQPVLGVCLGMQLLCRFSEEDNVKCLGVFDEQVLHFEPTQKVPHMGWNRLGNPVGKLFKGLQEVSYAYFVHSYYVPVSSYTIATTDYILPFSAAIQKENFYACQFHPEKSGKPGNHILKNFIAL